MANDLTPPSPAPVGPSASGGGAVAATTPKGYRRRRNWQPPKRLYVVHVGEKPSTETELTQFTAALQEAEPGVEASQTQWVEQLEHALRDKQVLPVALQALFRSMREGRAGPDTYTAHLRGAVAIAILLRENSHLDLTNEQGHPAFLDRYCFLGWAADQLGFGSSPTRLSLLCRAAELWLILRKKNLPLPRSLGPLDPLLKLTLAQAEKLYRELVAETKQAPGGPAISEAVARYRDRPKAAKPELGQDDRSWRSGARAQVSALQEAVATNPEDRAQLRQRAAGLMAYLLEKYARADTAVLSQLNLLRLRLLAAQPQGVALVLECHSRHLLLGFEPSMAPALQDYFRTHARQRKWSEEGSRLRYDLPERSAERLAKLKAERHWLSGLLRKLDSPVPAAVLGEGS